MKNEVFENIKEFTIKQTGVEKEKVTEDASLENDLGVYGDDAVDYIIAFGKKFNVDISKFMAADYFNAEGIDFIGPIVRVITGKEKAPKKILTMRHLEKAVIAGRLDEEIINS